MARIVPAVARAFGVLELFLGDRDELTAREVAAELEAPRTTVHELLHSLTELGYLAKSPTTRGAYRLGVRVLPLGAAFAERLDLAGEGRAVAEQLVAQCEETVHVAILDGTDVLYVAKVDSTRTIRMVSGFGHRIPAHCTAVGKMLLSRLPEAELTARFDAERLRQLTPQSIGTLTDLRAALDRIRAEGVAYEWQESNPDGTCVAAPVYDHTGSMVAALSITVPVMRWGTRTPAEWTRLAHTGADSLSRSLGGRTPEPRLR